MAFSSRRREKQVRLTLFNNEPMARLAEQRLREAGIPCNTRSLRGGPGLWGSAYNLPHDLYVLESDETRAREVLELAPRGPDEEPQESQPGTSQSMWRVLAGATLVVLLLVLIISLFNRSS